MDYKTKQNSANTISNVFNFNSKKEEDKTNEINKTKELEEKIVKLEQQLKSQQEDEDYKEWLKEKEMRKKKKKILKCNKIDWGFMIIFSLFLCYFSKNFRQFFRQWKFLAVFK